MDTTKWPEVCEKGGCENPHLLDHHHHTIDGYMTIRACVCSKPEFPGTRPPTRKEKRGK